MTEPSTHLTRDKKSNDALEGLLEEWGHWRGKRLSGTSFPRSSLSAFLNHPETAFTNKLDKQRALEDRRRIKELNVPRGTKTTKPVVLNYFGNRFWSKIDQLLSQIKPQYYKILIKKYEEEWETLHFEMNWAWTKTITWKQLSRARKASRKILKENGFKV